MAEYNTELVNRIERLVQRKTEIETEKRMLETQLTELKGEITKQGYDPEKLPEKIEELTKYISDFEAKALPVVDKIEKDLGIVANEKHLTNEFNGFEEPAK